MVVWFVGGGFFPRTSPVATIWLEVVVNEAAAFIGAIYVVFGVVYENYGVFGDVELRHSEMVCAEGYLVVTGSILEAHLQVLHWLAGSTVY